MRWRPSSRRRRCTSRPVSSQKIGDQSRQLAGDDTANRAPLIGLLVEIAAVAVIGPHHALGNSSAALPATSAIGANR